jgi:hypothetical protein
MASNYTTYGAQKASAEQNNGVTPPAQYYLALYTTTQDAAQSGTECSDANYTRQPVNWTAASGGVVANNGAVTFPGLATSQTFRAIGKCDSAVAGTLDAREVKDLDSPVTVGAGRQPTVVSGALTETMVPI